MGGTAILGAAACLCLGSVGLLATPAASSVSPAGTLADGHGAWRAHHAAVDLNRRPPTWSRSAPARCVGADTPATSASVNEMSAAVECLINQQRLRFGLPPMEASIDLDHSAQKWTGQMVASGHFTHGGEGAFTARLRIAGFSWAQAGENIATGYVTPRDAVAAWMASADHCQNILDPGYREMGTGESPAAVGSFASGPATWTQDFGLLRNQEPLSRDHGPQKGCPYRLAS